MAPLSKCLTTAVLACLPLLLSACQLPPTAGMAPATPIVAAEAAETTAAGAAKAAAITTARAIARGEVGNAISGTVELPVSFRTLSRLTDGAPPLTIHAFRVTGQVIREATVSLFWQDDHAIGYVVDGAPSDYPVVLAATVEPGIVVRALVPKASRERPARGQTIDQRSELIVMRAYLAGLIPPVGLGGTVEVVRQGGLDPAGAARANRQAVEVLERLGTTDWGRSTPEVGKVVSALGRLNLAQFEVASALTTASPAAWLEPGIATSLFASTTAAWGALEGLSSEVDAQVAQGRLPAGAIDLLAEASTHLETAVRSDVPKAATVVPSTGMYNLAQAPFRLQMYKALKPTLLMSIYEDLGVLASANTGYASPNGVPYSETEIADALENGKGPYRTSCAQVNFGGDTNCTVVINPLDRAQEVLIQREVSLFTKKLLALESAVAENDSGLIRSALMDHPALLNFIVDDKKRWTSPTGTWRMRLLQDVGAEMVGGGGFPVLSDAEMFLSPAGQQGTSDAPALSPGTFSGVLSVWMPAYALGDGGFISIDARDNLSNFAMRFDWDEQERTMLNGELRGERLDSIDGALRTDYSATFEGQMLEGNRVQGYWFNDERGMAGRFEMHVLSVNS